MTRVLVRMDRREREGTKRGAHSFLFSVNKEGRRPAGALLATVHAVGDSAVGRGCLCSHKSLEGPWRP